jgi:hypothetical protein
MKLEELLFKLKDTGISYMIKYDSNLDNKIKIILKNEDIIVKKNIENERNLVGKILELLKENFKNNELVKNLK